MYHAILVDDEPLTREYLRGALPALNNSWEVSGEAGNGKEALDAVASSPAELVITDIKMPVMDGIELVERLKTQNPNQHIIVLSGYDEFELAQKALRFGAEEYLLKPVKPRELAVALNRITARIQKEQESSLTLNTLRGLAGSYRDQVAKNYLKAIITGDYVELNVFHPLLHDLKIDLLEGAGCILSLHLDIESMLRAGIKPSKFFLYQHMLYEGVCGLTSSVPLAYPLTDEQGNTAVYLTASDAEHLQTLSRQLYESAMHFSLERLYISINGGLGGLRSEMLELQSSYLEANERADGWVCDPYKTFFTAAPSLSQQELLQRLNSYADQLLFSARQDESRFYSLLRSAADFIPAEPSLLKRSAIYLFSRIMLRDTQRCCFDYDRLFGQLCTAQGAESPCALLLRLSEDCSKKQSSPPAKGLIENAEEYIRRHFSEPITLAQIADHLKVSPNYLSSQFHERVGESYVKYITRLRMEYAAHLLKTEPAGKIAQIAERAGYCSIKHFAYVFKEYFGVTPGQYQKQSE